MHPTNTRHKPIRPTWHPSSITEQILTLSSIHATSIEYNIKSRQQHSISALIINDHPHGTAITEPLIHKRDSVSFPHTCALQLQIRDRYAQQQRHSLRYVTARYIHIQLTNLSQMPLYRQHLHTPCVSKRRAHPTPASIQLQPHLINPESFIVPCLKHMYQLPLIAQSVSFKMP